MNKLIRIFFFAIVLCTIVGCGTTEERPDHPGQRNILGLRLHGDVLGLGASLGGNIHTAPSGGVLAQSRQQMMLGFFGPCDPALQDPGRLWVESAVNAGAKGGKREHAVATVSQGRPFCWWKAEGGSEGMRGMGQW